LSSTCGIAFEFFTEVIGMNSFFPKTGSFSKYHVEQDLSFIPYIVRNFSLGLSCEALVRYFDWVKSNPSDPDKGIDTLSLKKLDYFQILPAAQAKNVENVVHPDQPVADKLSDVETVSICEGSSCQPLAAETPDEIVTAPETSDSSLANNSTSSLWTWTSDQYESLKGRVTDSGSTKAITGCLSENQEWLAVTGSVVGVYSVFNYMTANRIKPWYVRNPLSMAVGVGVTCLGSYVIGNQLNVNLVADIGLRVMAYHGLVQAFAKPAYWSLGQSAKVVSFLTKPMAFASQQKKAK